MFKHFIPSRSFLVQMGVAGVLATASDATCQMVVEKNKSYDWPRTFRFVGLTVGAIAPLQYVWFNRLERMVPGPGNLKNGIKRVFLDQTIAAPTLTYGFIWGLKLLEGGPNVATTYTNGVILEVMKMNYYIWPVTQLINLTVVPLRFRVTWVQVVGGLWNIYVSYMAHLEKNEGGDGKDEG